MWILTVGPFFLFKRVLREACKEHHHFIVPATLPLLPETQRPQMLSVPSPLNAVLRHPGHAEIHIQLIPSKTTVSDWSLLVKGENMFLWKEKAVFIVNFTGITIVLYDVLLRSVHGSAGTDDDEVCNSFKRVILRRQRNYRRLWENLQWSITNTSCDSRDHWGHEILVCFPTFKT